MPIDEILNANIRHAIDLERYKNGVVRRIITLLNKVDEDIVRQISLSDLTEFAQGRLLMLEAQIKTMIEAGSDQIQRSLETELRGLVEAELEFHESTITALSTAATGRFAIAGGVQIDRLNADDVYAAAVGQPFRGRTLKEWFDSLDDNKRRRLLDELRIGYLEGESLSQLVGRIRGTRGAGFADGVLEHVSRKDAESIVRTAVQYFSNFALKKTMERAGVDYYQWISVLDRRTTPICRGRSNKIYKMGGPMPPAHVRCRSITVPLRSNSEKLDVPSYGQWLKEQPRSVVEDILGKAKAKLFLDGNLSLDRFINRAGDELTLAELRKRYPRYWDKAGLNKAA